MAVTKTLTPREQVALEMLKVFLPQAPSGTMFGANYPDNNDNYMRAAFALADSFFKDSNRGPFLPST